FERPAPHVITSSGAACRYGRIWSENEPASTVLTFTSIPVWAVNRLTTSSVSGKIVATVSPAAGVGDGETAESTADGEDGGDPSRAEGVADGVAVAPHAARRFGSDAIPATPARLRRTARRETGCSTIPARP